MKRIGIIMVSLLTVMSVSRAQNVQITKEAKITQNEVPVEVLQSFERDFYSLGGLDAEGQWSVEYSPTNVFQGEELPTPLHYSFKLKDKVNNQEVKATYFPNGHVKKIKGLAEARDTL